MISSTYPRDVVSTVTPASLFLPGTCGSANGACWKPDLSVERTLPTRGIPDCSLTFRLRGANCSKLQRKVIGYHLSTTPMHLHLQLSRRDRTMTRKDYTFPKWLREEGQDRLPLWTSTTRRGLPQRAIIVFDLYFIAWRVASISVCHFPSCT